MKILMVCLGNICRSPLAEGIMRSRSRLLGLDVTVDSAGTSAWHSGETPDQRSVDVAFANGIDIREQRSRQVTSSDFDVYDVIVAMDKANERDLRRRCEYESQRSKIIRLLDYNDITDLGEVPDPYYYGGFDFVFELIDQACQGMCEAIERGDFPR